MSHLTIARGMLALLCGMQGIGTLAIDLNQTHATNPLWPRHARFHLVWQAISYALLSMLEVVLILTPGPMQAPRFYLAAILAGVPMVGFLAAFVCRRLYGGALSDPNGIPPMKVAFRGSERGIDLSLIVEVAALLLIAGAVALFRT